MAAPNPNITTLIANIIAADAVYHTRSAGVLQKIKTYVWGHFTNTDGNDLVTTIQNVTDVDGLGAAIVTEFTTHGVTSALGGLAYWLEQITNGVMTYPDVRAANDSLPTRTS